MLTIKKIKKKSADIILHSQGRYKDNLSLLVLWKTKKTFHGIVFSKKIGVGTFNGHIYKGEGIKIEFDWVTTYISEKKRDFPTRIISGPIRGTKMHYHKDQSRWDLSFAEDTEIIRWKKFHRLHPHWI